MFNKTFIPFLFILFLSQQILSGPKYPFPLYRSYKYGIKSSIKDSVRIQKAYNTFHDNYYEESGSYARIKWDEPEYTVSEGIGYGMLIMVYMDNTQNNTQSKFDKLWNYYEKWVNGNGLMHWKIRGFSNVDQQNAATDAELDVALALLMAHKQWADEKYKTDAKDLIGKIWQHEVNQNKYLKPGDAWDDRKNPSYFCTAALEAFKEVDSNDWTTVISNSYTLLKACRNSNTGLVPDWCSEQGNPMGDYGYDAARTPLRIAWAYVWFGHSDAKDVAGKMAQWIKTSTGGDPAEIVDGYSLEGSKTGGNNNPIFLAPFTCSGMVDATHEQWLTDAYARLRTFTGDDNYYNESIQLLSMLLLTGNMQNLWNIGTGGPYKILVTVSPPEGGTVTKDPSQDEYDEGTEVTVTATPNTGYKFSSWGGDISGTEALKTFQITYDMNISATFVKEGTDIDLVDDCEDGDEINRLGGKWFTYDDSTSEGASTVIPKTSEDNTFVMTDGGYNSQKAAKISFNLDQGDNQYDPFVGVGFTLDKDEKEKDISKATGITFYHKGYKCIVRIETANVEDYGYYVAELDASIDWTFVSLNWDGFDQPPWADEVPLDLTKTLKISWQIEGETGDNGEVWIDKIHLPGVTVPIIVDESLSGNNTKGFSLSFSPSAAMALVKYTLHQNSDVRIGIYNINGRLIKRIINGHRNSGHHTVKIDLSEAKITNGMYIVRLTTGTELFSGKLMFLK